MTARQLGAALDRFAPISLDELNAQADLLVRVDRKYVLPAERAVALLSEMDHAAALALQIDGRRTFGYQSHYFDTPQLDSYRTTALKRRRRFKVRTRRYCDAGETFLEVKTRGPRGATVKHRVGYPDHCAQFLDPTGRAFVGAVLGDQAVPLDDVDGLRPVLTTGYHRSTLLLPGPADRAPARLTIDTELCWWDLGHQEDRLHDDTSELHRRPCGTHIALPGVVIVETKNRGAASAFDRLLWSHGHRPVSISKYGTGMAALHRELTSSRWHRLLARLDAYRVEEPVTSTTNPGGTDPIAQARSPWVAHQLPKEALSCVAPS